MVDWASLQFPPVVAIFDDRYQDKLIICASLASLPSKNDCTSEAASEKEGDSS